MLSAHMFLVKENKGTDEKPAEDCDEQQREPLGRLVTCNFHLFLIRHKNNNEIYYDMQECIILNNKKYRLLFISFL